MSSAPGMKIPATHDSHQPRSSPMIQLSPSPEIEPLPMPNILPTLDNVNDPDSMDWEATGPSINHAINLRESPQKSTLAKSAWDRFATTKQRMFVKDQLTGLERAFESWRDLGGTTNSQKTQHRPVTGPAISRLRVRQRRAERAAYMLASVLRILSLALIWPTKARALSTESERGNGTGFGIAASILEAAVDGPWIASSPTWAMQVRI